MAKKIILVTITIMWMLSIFMFSNQPSKKSTEKSHSLVMSTIVKVYKLFDNNISDEKIESIIDSWDVPVRKIAHFTEFFILGLLVFFTLRAFEFNNIYIMILLCFLYACSDEIHQMFVVGRDGNFVDVILDSLGSSSAILILNKLKVGNKNESRKLRSNRTIRKEKN